MRGNALSDETVTNAGTIEVLANGALAIDQGSTVDNSSGDVIVDGNAALTLDHATISGGAIKGAGTIDVTGASKIDSAATLSISAVTVESGVTLTLDDATVVGTAIVNHGTVNVDASKTLTLNGASLTGGTLTIAGTLESTGTSAIDNADVGNTGTISVTSGTLTIDPGILHAITNHGLIEAVTGGTLKLTASTIANAGGIDHGRRRVKALSDRRLDQRRQPDQCRQPVQRLRPQHDHGRRHQHRHHRSPERHAQPVRRHHRHRHADHRR